MLGRFGSVALMMQRLGSKGLSHMTTVVNALEKSGVSEAQAFRRAAQAHAHVVDAQVLPNAGPAYKEFVAAVQQSGLTRKDIFQHISGIQGREPFDVSAETRRNAFGWFRGLLNMGHGPKVIRNVREEQGLVAPEQRSSSPRPGSRGG